MTNQPSFGSMEHYIQLLDKCTELEKDNALMRDTIAREMAVNQRLEQEKKTLSVRVGNLERRFAEYSHEAITALDGLDAIFEAFIDVLQYEDGPREVVKFIKAFVGRSRRNVPEWRINDKGILAIHDDIPF